MTRRAAHPGFTLIESIIAVVVISVAIPPMLWAIRDANAKRVDPVVISRAGWLASEKLEDIIADRHGSTRGYSYVLTVNYPSEASVTGFPGYTRSVSVSETAANLSGAGTGYKTVSVNVGFVDGKGAARSVTLSTVLTDYTP